MKLPKSILILVFLISTNIYSQDTFKAMFYNLLNYPLQEPTSRLQYLEYVLNDYQPDLFMVCELNNLTGANSILSLIQQNINPNMVMANFVLNTSDDNIGNQNDLQNLIYYDSSKFVLEYQTLITTIYRDFNRYVLKLNTIEQDTNPIYLEVFVCHLKASSGTDNETLRELMVDDLEAYLNNPSNNFNSDTYVLLAGDFNVYNSSEDAFQELINPVNTITFTDPANRIGYWHNNTDYLDVFTQSTRTSSALGGSTGGFDDRFDFILTSENMQSDTELSFVPNSYQVYGNNNNTNCYNQEINSTNCDGTDFSFDLRNALYNFSDHLPVTLQLQTNESLSNPEFALQDRVSFTNGNLLTNTLKLKVNFELISSQNLIIYNTLGQKIKTIAINNSTYISEDISALANGVYYLLVEDGPFKPLNFIKYN